MNISKKDKSLLIDGFSFYKQGYVNVAREKATGNISK